MGAVHTRVHTPAVIHADLQGRSSLSEPIRACKGLTKAGAQCRSRGVRASGYCFAHEQAPEVLSELGRKAGIASGAARRELGKTPRQRLADRAEEHSDLIWAAFEDGLRSEDERTRLAAAVQVLEQAYGKTPVAIVGDAEKPVAFQIVSAFAAGLDAGGETT